MSKYLNEQGLTRLVSLIKEKLNTKVDKVEGKGLSTNNFTDEEKEKLANCQAGSFLDTQKNYDVPYEPLYDGSPTTKKYVDSLRYAKETKNTSLPYDVLSGEENFNISLINNRLVISPTFNTDTIPIYKEIKIVFDRDFSVGELYFHARTYNKNNDNSAMSIGIGVQGLPSFNSSGIPVRPIVVDTQLQTNNVEITNTTVISIIIGYAGEPNTENMEIEFFVKGNGQEGFLSTDNQDEYTPTNDYSPATKLYVDNKLTSTFFLGENENINKSIAQEIVNLHLLNKDVLIIKQSNTLNSCVMYFSKSQELLNLQYTISGYKYFENKKRTKYSSLIANYYYIVITMDSGNQKIVSSVSSFSSEMALGDYLDVNGEYDLDYTPIKDCQPTTKKYVDDSIDSAIGQALARSY